VPELLYLYDSWYIAGTRLIARNYRLTLLEHN